MSEDLAVVEPFRRRFPVTDIPPGHRWHLEDVPKPKLVKSATPLFLPDDEDNPEDMDDAEIDKDVATLQSILDVIAREQKRAEQGQSLKDNMHLRLPFDADTIIIIGDIAFPAHHVILAARSTVFHGLLSGKKLPKGSQKENIGIRMDEPRPGLGRGVVQLTQLTITGAHVVSLLILLHYLYSDEVLAIWDRRIQLALMNANPTTDLLDVGKIKADLLILAAMLELAPFAEVLQAPVKRAPRPTLTIDLFRLFNAVQPEEEKQGLKATFSPDVVLELRDREVRTHSVILRARSEYFASLLGEEVWTRKRWGTDGVLRVNLRHLRWHVMEYVLKFMICGQDAEIFQVLRK